MTKYVIGPDVAMRLARERAAVRDGHQLLAPTLIRSQVLSLLYRAVQRAELTESEADERLTYVRRSDCDCTRTVISTRSGPRRPR
jgi:predicted nucleic acid-binding protein